LLAAGTVLALVALYAALVRGPGVPAPGPKTFRIELHQGRLVSSPAVLDVAEGDAVTFHVRSDAAATLHVHEYEQQLVVPLTPGVDATASFTAARAGRFPVHVIGIDPSHPEVAAIQVHPR
jgi:plastocyanin